MRIPYEDDLRRERARFMDTIESLSDEEFENGRTLCERWTPRDVLAHIVGTDRMLSYFEPSGLTVNRTNAKMARDAMALSRSELTKRGRQAASNPTFGGRAWAWLLTGDCVMHHQDVLRGLGRPHDLPAESERFIFREGTIWSWPSGAKLLRHRVIPVESGVKPRGRGRKVYGTTEALAMWLAGRKSVSDELEFE